ncbi:hypothetical protein BDV33DRAFT_178024 [Aspergillus novoparasiticus]|uniref:Uncharacterized protein n=1 Tax=Aspergillus novoparasiticus TaxID=986946 RepID=A0A5N6EHU9_9EURO|nr:hypothetical protein BDV33DRAFT_178024 [Aspergillus novoparasiticus]
MTLKDGGFVICGIYSRLGLTGVITWMLILIQSTYICAEVPKQSKKLSRRSL